MSDYSAFILGAGFGTRLSPLTLSRPKPLMPLLGRPLIDYALATLRQAGIKHIIVNAHHLWPQLAEWAERNDVELQVELPVILGTGGGLKAAESRLNQTVIIWNGDILCDVSAKEILEACPENGAVMALRHSEHLGKTTPLLHNGQEVSRIGDVCSIEGTPAAVRGGKGFHFTGIHAMSKACLSLIPTGEQCVVRTAYKILVPQSQVSAVIHTGYWLDIGNPKEYLDTALAVLNNQVTLPIDPWNETQQHQNSWVHKSSSLKGNVSNSIVEANSIVPKDADLESCIVWDGVLVKGGQYKRCIFYGEDIFQVE